jgi:hypothetical protein
MSNFKFQMPNVKSNIVHWIFDIGSIGHSQLGITSLSALIIVMLIVIVAWQGGKYIDNYFDSINESDKAAQNEESKYKPSCEGKDSGECDFDEPTGELPPPAKDPFDNEVFSWDDDGKP